MPSQIFEASANHFLFCVELSGATSHFEGEQVTKPSPFSPETSLLVPTNALVLMLLVLERAHIDVMVRYVYTFGHKMSLVEFLEFVEPLLVIFFFCQEEFGSFSCSYGTITL